MSALSNADRVRLARLNESAEALPWKPKRAGRALADDLRRALPDLDDVAIGQVLLEVSGFLGAVAKDSDEMGVATDVVMCAALDLTSTEWQEATR